MSIPGNRSSEPGFSLSEDNLKMLREGSGISDQVIVARGYRTIYRSSELDGLGFSQAQRKQVPGLLLPIYTTDGDSPFCVYRPDSPRVHEDKRKRRNPDGTYPNKVIKYEIPK